MPKKVHPPPDDSAVKAAEIASRRGFKGVIIAGFIAALAAISVAIINNCGNLFKPTPSPLSFTGRAINRNSEERIRGAKVSLEGDGIPAVAYTDSEGIFSFRLEDPNKEIHLRIEANQYDNFDLRVTPAKNQGIQEIRLTPQTETRAELSGTVYDANNNRLQGAQVTLDDIPGMAPVETSSDGVFIIKEIPRKYGEGVRIRVSKDGYQPYPYTEDVVLGKASPIVTLRKKK
jgi:hypothetical protein